MSLVRQVFETKWGNSPEIVEMFKQSAQMLRRASGTTARVRVLTDLSGPYNIVVQEIESTLEPEAAAHPQTAAPASVAAFVLHPTFLRYP